MRFGFRGAFRHSLVLGFRLGFWSFRLCGVWFSGLELWGSFWLSPETLNLPYSTVGHRLY